MSAYATSSPSASATRRYRTREPSLRRTWWKLMSRSSVAENILTPMFTRPNDTAPFQIARIDSPVSDRLQLASMMADRGKIASDGCSPDADARDARPHAAGWSGLGVRVQMGRRAGPGQRDGGP